MEKKKTERGGVATRDVGKYNAYTKESWNDETLVGDDTADPQKIVAQLVEEEGRAGEFVGDSGLVDTAGLKRRTPADEHNDQRSLERMLQRTLYLLVKRKAREGKPESWVFPSGMLVGREGLHQVSGQRDNQLSMRGMLMGQQTAKRVLDETCGPNMNTWFVGRHPAGHYISGPDMWEPSSPPVEQKPKEDTADFEGEKTFFMKARIFAGQADLQGANGYYEDFTWLAKEEIEQKVHPKYWSKVKNMLVAQ